MERTGGIAGVHDTTVIEPSGEWTRDSRRGGSRTGRLTGEQQRQLGRLLNDPRLPEEARTTPGRTSCRDAFNYRIMIDSMTISYVDCPSEQMPPATSAVVAFVETTTRG